MTELLKKYGVPVGIVIAAIVAIYFYGKSQYQAGRNDLRTELLLQPAKLETVRIANALPPIIGEGAGKSLFDRKWTRIPTQLNIDSVGDTPDMIVLHSDSCCDLTIPYIVTVADSDLTGEIICKPDVQRASWRLTPVTRFITSEKFIQEQFSFWLNPIMTANSSGTGIGAIIGYKGLGVGILYDGSPTYIVGLHFNF